MQVDAGEAFTVATIRLSITGHGTHFIVAARIHAHKGLWIFSCVEECAFRA